MYDWDFTFKWLDISAWDISGVTDFSGMFKGVET